jgi:hypothetical protein
VGWEIGKRIGEAAYERFPWNGYFFWETAPPIPQTTSTSSGGSGIPLVQDPNELIGPAGYGQRNYLVGDSLFAYRIDFENESNATAPAQQVSITDQLTNTLDWQTFELTEIAFGDHFIAVPPKTQHFERTEKLRFNGVDFEVQIEAGIHLANGQVYATFRSLNPTNGLPPTVDVGLLPPENGTGRGQGHIGYTIRALTNLTTGTEIRNTAAIQFDYNPALRTDLVDPHNTSAGVDTNKQALVTIDANPPSSAVTGPSGTATNAQFTVSWSGSDVGSGIASYDIYVQTNGGPWAVWLSGATANLTTFFGQNGKIYGFYSVAHDGTGNVETNAAAADVTVTTLPNYPPVVDPVSNQSVVVGQQLVITNSATDPDGVVFLLGNGAPAGATLTTNGIFRWTPACAQGSTTNSITIWAADLGTPPLSNSIMFTVTVPECIEASLGNAVVQAGQTSSVPVRLLSTTALTNMAFTLVYPAERFTNFTLTVNSPQVLTQWLQSLGAGNLEVTFTLPSDSVLKGPTNIGELVFTAVANQSSAFVPLPIKGVTGFKPDGGLVGNAYGQAGRVVVVGNEPLLEAFLYTNRDVILIVYGTPGSTNQILSGPDLPTTGTWTNFTTVALTNLFEFINVNNATNGMKFFRVKRP